MGTFSCAYCGKVLVGAENHSGECAQRQVEAMSEKLRAESKEQVTAMAALLREHIDRALMKGEKRFVKLEDEAKRLRADWRDELVHAMPDVEPMEQHEADVLHGILHSTSTETLTSVAKRLMRELDVCQQHEKDHALVVQSLKKQMADGFAARDHSYACLVQTQRSLFGAIGEALEPGAGNAPVVVDAAIADVQELRHLLDESERRYGAAADERNKLMSQVNDLRRQIQDAMTEGC